LQRNQKRSKYPFYYEDGSLARLPFFIFPSNFFGLSATKVSRVEYTKELRYHKCMFSIFYKTLQHQELKELDTPKSGSLIVVGNPTKQDVEYVSQLTGFQTTDLHDVLDAFEIPRVELHTEGMILYLRHPASHRAGLHTELLTVVLTDKYTILLARANNTVVETLLANSSDTITTQKTKLLLRVLSIIAKFYTMEVRKISDEVVRRKSDLKSVSSKDIDALVEHEDILNQFISSLSPMKTIFENLTQSKKIKFYDQDEDLFQDVMIGINQSVELCLVYRKNITSLRDSYQMVFTNKLNNTMKFLASFTIIMTIPNIVAGLFGMNVALPLGEHPLAFILILTVILSICTFVVVIFNRMRWL